MEFLDQLGRVVCVKMPPERIVSVVPSQTEFLYSLGLSEKITGQTVFCIHPENQFKNATKVGGTKKLNLEKIRQLQPDIIIANKEENDQQQIEELASEFPVWISNIYNLDDALEMMQNLGTIFQRAPEAADLVQAVKSAFLNLQPSAVPHRVLYLIWKDPFMAAGSSTFIDDMLERCGFRNVITHPDSRYPEISTAELQRLDPDLILLSSEPYPFSEKHMTEISAHCPRAEIRLADGEMFSWYGNRLLKSADYFGRLIRDLDYR